MLEGMQIHFVHTAEEALEIALGKFDKQVRPVPGGPVGQERPPAPGPVH
jgi:hypothetical protein